MNPVIVVKDPAIVSLQNQFMEAEELMRLAQRAKSTALYRLHDELRKFRKQDTVVEVNVRGEEYHVFPNGLVEHYEDIEDREDE